MKHKLFHLIIHQEVNYKHLLILTIYLVLLQSLFKFKQNSQTNNKILSKNQCIREFL